MVSEEKVTERAVTVYEDKSDRFKQIKKDYSRQFCHLYSARLKLMRDNVLKEVHRKYGNALLYYLFTFH